MRESMLHQTLHVRVTSDTEKFSLLIGPNDVVRYDVTSFPPFVSLNVISDGPTNVNYIVLHNDIKVFYMKHTSIYCLSSYNRLEHLFM